MRNFDMTYVQRNLSELDSSLRYYRGEHKGASPASLEELFPGPILKELPWLVLAESGHAATQRVRTLTAAVKDEKGLSAAIKDTGQWLYVFNPESRYHGRVFIDCTHGDKDGKPWWKQGLLLKRRARHRTSTEVLAARLKEREGKLAEATREGCRSYELGYAAYAAFDAGDLRKARGYASELLALGAKDPKDWDHGNALHHGNIVLGRVALREGRLAAARAHLLAAGHTPGSPQLNSFGPNTSLAAALLERGDKRTVDRFLELVGRFWPQKRQLAEWRRSLARGGWPNLDCNAGYGK